VHRRLPDCNTAEFVSVGQVVVMLVTLDGEDTTRRISGRHKSV